MPHDPSIKKSYILLFMQAMGQKPRLASKAGRRGAAPGIDVFGIALPPPLAHNLRP